jgi:hypothetical protein
MKINKSSSKKSIVIISLIVLLLVGTGVGAYFYMNRSGSNSEAENSKQQKQTDNKAKQEFIEGTDENGNPKENQDDTENKTPTPADSVSLNVERSETSGGVTIYTKLNGVSGGTCSLEVKNNSQVITKTAPVIYQEEYSSCAGFSLTSSEKTTLGTGTWAIILSVTDGGATHTGKTSFEAR